MLPSMISRRAFLGQSACGIGTMALGSILNAATPRGGVDPLHVARKAKRVIFLYMSGGPSHLETFDPKPELAKLHGQPMPESFTKGQPIAQLQNAKLSCLGPQMKFNKCGKSGQEISELFPHM